MKNSQKAFENKAVSRYRVPFYQQVVQTLLLYASQDQQEQRRFLWLSSFFGLNESFLKHA